jgi:hypothetical protein
MLASPLRHSVNLLRPSGIDNSFIIQPKIPFGKQVADFYTPANTILQSSDDTKDESWIETRSLSLGLDHAFNLQSLKESALGSPGWSSMAIQGSNQLTVIQFDSNSGELRISTDDTGYQTIDPNHEAVHIPGLHAKLIEVEIALAKVADSGFLHFTHEHRLEEIEKIGNSYQIITDDIEEIRQKCLNNNGGSTNSLHGNSNLGELEDLRKELGNRLDDLVTAEIYFSLGARPGIFIQPPGPPLQQQVTDFVQQMLLQEQLLQQQFRQLDELLELEHRQKLQEQCLRQQQMQELKQAPRQQQQQLVQQHQQQQLALQQQLQQRWQSQQQWHLHQRLSLQQNDFAQ